MDKFNQPESVLIDSRAQDAARVLEGLGAAPVVLRAADPAQNAGRREVAFVDTAVSDYQILVDGIRPGVEVVLLDAGYTGVEKREEILAEHPEVELHVAEKRGKIKALPEGKLKDLKKALEKAKAQVRALVEHPFHVIKNLFRHRKARYRGLAKNQAQLYSLFALANLTLAKRSLLGATRA